MVPKVLGECVVREIEKFIIRQPPMGEIDDERRKREPT